MEQTLVILKPDAIQRQITGEIISRFEKVGLRIVGCKMLQPDREHYYHHYETISQMISRHSEDVFEYTLNAIQEGPVIAMVWEGVGAISIARKLVGTTYPDQSPPGTIRGDYAHISQDYANQQKRGVHNLVHASGNAEEAKLEISHWFKPDELFEYNTAHDHFTQFK